MEKKKIWLKICGRVSQFSTFIKIYRPLILNWIFDYSKNDLFTKCRSDFYPGDSFISQLLSVTHDICKLFDCNPQLDVTGTL